MADWLTGLLTGYNTRRHDIEAEHVRQAENNIRAQEKIYNVLLNSEDEEAKSIAATGLLFGAKGPQLKRDLRGLGGWLGQIQENPALDQIRGLIGKNRTITETLSRPGLESLSSTGRVAGPTIPPEQRSLGRPGRGDLGLRGEGAYPEIESPEEGLQRWYREHDTRESIGAPPQPQAPLALPDSNPTEIGAPPQPRTQTLPAGQMAPLTTIPPDFNLRAPEIDATASVTAEMPPEDRNRISRQLTQGPDIPYTISREVPRNIFPTQRYLTEQLTAGQYSGRVEGILDAMRQQGIDVTPELAQQVALELSGYNAPGAGRGAGSLIFGDTIGPDGTRRPTALARDPVSGEYTEYGTGERLSNFQRSAVTGSATLGQNRETAARMLRDPNTGQHYPNAASAMAAGRGAEVEYLANQLTQQNAFNRGLGNTEGIFAGPLSIQGAGATGGAVPAGTRGTQVQDQRIPTAEQTQRRDTVEGLKTHVAGLLPLMRAVLPSRAESVTGGWAVGAEITGRRLLPKYSEGFANLDSAILNIQSLLSRTVRGEMGTQTEQDAMRSIRTLMMVGEDGAILANPLVGDTQEDAAARISRTLALLDTIERILPPRPVPTAVAAPPPAPTPPAIPQVPAAYTVPTPPANNGGPAAAPEVVPPDKQKGFWQSPTTGKSYFNGKEI